MCLNSLIPHVYGTLWKSVCHIDVRAKMVCLASKTCCRVLGYNEIDAKLCQEAGVGRIKSLKTIY